MPSQNIGLDGVVLQQENYKKSGFKLAYRNIRYEGIGIIHNTIHSHIISLNQIYFDQLVTYDTTIFLLSRKNFLSSWIKQLKSLAIGYIDNNEIKGYGMIRQSQTGYKIGPLFADDNGIAETLLNHLLSFAGANNPVFLDVPEVNKEAVKLAESHGMKSIFETARMYTKAFPDVPLHKVYGVTSFELG